ncbi:MAG TPA: pitrilysin family protein [Anaeromyxobacteraceae bacterium]|nr:pitrilysin family protein [Anaeromyxobacteraceae bacterium]
MRTLPALLAAAALAVSAARADAPGSAPRDAAPSVPFEMFRLPNGLTVVLHVDHTTPIVGIHVQYDVGSKDEKPGRTGFAHLFEHLMFQGTEHLPKGVADRLVDAAGGEGNASTSEDTTQYWEQVPSNALEQMLFVQSERMGFLLPAIDQEKLDNQREVVRNERRQNFEMRPYGLAFKAILENLWPDAFPYHWWTIGSHEDLQAATLEDVKEFFRTWYGPENAVLVVAGDVDPAATRTMVERWFGWIPGKAPPVHERPSPAPLREEKRVTLEDDVQLPRLYVAWQTPKLFAPGDAALDVLAQVLTDGKSARLFKRLVMDERIAQSVMAAQMSHALAGGFLVVATPKPGVDPERLLREIDEEIAKVAKVLPGKAELERARNKIESGAVFAVEPLGGFGGRAAMLANYYLRTGNPGFLPEDIARYRALSAQDVSDAARRYLGAGRVVLTVVPRAGAKAAGAGGAPKAAPGAAAGKGDAP